MTSSAQQSKVFNWGQIWTAVLFFLWSHVAVRRTEAWRGILLQECAGKRRQLDGSIFYSKCCFSALMVPLLFPFSMQFHLRDQRWRAFYCLDTLSSMILTSHSYFWRTETFVPFMLNHDNLTCYQWSTLAVECCPRPNFKHVTGIKYRIYLKKSIR